MKKLLFITMLLTTSVLVGQTRDFIKTYEGATGDNQGFYMKIKSFSGEIQGTMFFKNKCESLTIEGKLNTDRSINIKAYNASKLFLYQFIGTAENNSKIQGEFREYKNINTFFALESSENFDTLLLNCNSIKKITGLKTLVIDKIVLNTFPSTKKNGNPWDGAMTGYKADIYFNVSTKDGEVLYTKPNYFLDISVNNLPLDMKASGINLDANKLNGMLCISFYDHDSITEHDYLGGVCAIIPTNNIGTKTNNLIMTYEDISFTVTYHYEQ